MINNPVNNNVYELKAILFNKYNTHRVEYYD